jgi:hypothetical protein
MRPVACHLVTPLDRHLTDRRRARRSMTECAWIADFDEAQVEWIH